jgi:phosphoglycolate phosphatase
MIRAIVFDLDGTLLNTLDDLAAAIDAALLDLGLPALASGTHRLLIGAGANNLARNTLIAAAAQQGLPAAALPPDLPARLKSSFLRKYSQAWDIKTRPYPGIVELLGQLRATGVPLALLSNKPEEFTQAIAKHYFEPGLFQMVAGQSEYWPLKPDPALALELCRQMGADPADTALVGDSGTDMETARRARMQPLGVLWGFRAEDELVREGAAHVFAAPEGLGSYLLERIGPLKAGDRA